MKSNVTHIREVPAVTDLTNRMSVTTNQSEEMVKELTEFLRSSTFGKFNLFVQLIDPKVLKEYMHSDSVRNAYSARVMAISKAALNASELTMAIQY